MDSDSYDDLLFGLPDSQESLDDVWSDISEDEMLDIPAEDELVTVDLRSSPMLMPSSTNIDIPEQINVGYAEADHPVIERPLRDRYGVHTCNQLCGSDALAETGSLLVLKQFSRLSSMPCSKKVNR